MLKHRIDQSVVPGFFRRHEVVSVRVLFDLIQRLARVLIHQFIHPSLGADDFLGMDFEFDRGPLHPCERLVDHDAAVGKRESLALGSRCQQHRAHAGTLSETVGGDVATDKLHGVVDRHTRGDRTTGAVDIHVDVSLAVFELKVQQLSNDAVRDIVVDGTSQQDDPIAEQATVNVHRPFFTAVFLNNVRNK